MIKTARTNQMIRQCRSDEFEVIGEIINDAAQAYRGVIPADRWHEPYMSSAELAEQMKQGVVFWGTEQDGKLSRRDGDSTRPECHAHPACVCAHGLSQPGHRERFVKASAHLDDPTDSDRDLGGGSLGRGLLREARFSEGQPRRKRTGCSKNTGRFLNVRLKPRWCWRMINGLGRPNRKPGKSMADF